MAQDADGTLWYRNLWLGVTAQVPGADNVLYHDVDDGVVAWVEGRQVFTYRPGIAGASATLEYTVTDPLTIDSIQVHGDYIAVTVTDTDEDARVIDVKKIGATDVNPGSVYNESNPVVFHTGVAWQTDQGGDEHVFFKVLGDSVTNVAGTAADETVRRSTGVVSLPAERRGAQLRRLDGNRYARDRTHIRRQPVRDCR